MSADTELDKKFNRVKNHRLFVWVLIFGVITITLASFTNSLQSLWGVVRPLFTKGPTTAIEKTADDIPGPCRFIVVNPVFKVASHDASDNYDTIVRFDGFQLSPKKLSITEPFALAINDYKTGTYSLDIKMGLVLAFSGSVTLTDAQYYLYEPVTKVANNFTSTEPIVLKVVSRREAQLALARYNIDFPKCDTAKIGPTW